MGRKSKYLFPGFLGMALCLFMMGNAQLGSPQGADGLVLARVEVTGSLSDLSLPVYAHLQDSNGRDYALVLASPRQLGTLGQSFQILDANAQNATYAIAIQRRPEPRADIEGFASVIHDDGRQVILRTSMDQSDALAGAGFDFQWLRKTPIVREVPLTALRALRAISHSPTVAEIISQVTETKTKDYLSGLTGVQPVTIGGTSYTIATRHTNSGTPIQKATQYAYEFMQNKGLTVSYHNWTSGRNVVGVKTGATKPQEVVVIVAHLDDMPSGGTAPGADDNGTGSVGVLLAAEILSKYTFDRTLRFVLVTGEEQGLLGSDAYAAACKANGDNIVAVQNMDMIGTDDPADAAKVNVHTRTSTNSGYQADWAIATTFSDVVSLYKIGIQAMLKADGSGSSDHVSFWSEGYPSVMTIEEDFSANYHTVNDKLQYISIPFFTNVVKASLGTIAHLAGVGQSTEPDTTAPKATASESGTSGVITLSATATDNVGVTKVDFYVDNSLKGTDTTSPYSMSLDSTTLSNGTHSLVAKAYDAAGNVGTSSAVNFSINNSTSGYTEVENNGTRATANTVADSVANVTGKIGASGDIDYFKINVAAGRTVTVKMTGPSGKDFDLYLENSSGTVLKSGTTSTSSETVTYTNNGAAAVYYIRVIGYSTVYDAVNNYTLTLTR